MELFSRFNLLIAVQEKQSILQLLIHIHKHYTLDNWSSTEYLNIIMQSQELI